MLRKKANGVAVGSQVSSLLKNVASHKMDRRTFLRSTGFGSGWFGCVFDDAAFGRGSSFCVW